MFTLETFYDFRKGCVDAVSRMENYVNETWGHALQLQYKPQKIAAKVRYILFVEATLKRNVAGKTLFKCQ